MVDSSRAAWSPPPINELKMNSDAAFDEGANVTGLGVVVRDYWGLPKLIVMKKVVQCLHVSVGEAMALLVGLKCALSHDLRPAILESDSKEFVELSNSRSSGQAEVDVFLGELKALLSSLPIE